MRLSCFFSHIVGQEKDGLCQKFNQKQSVTVNHLICPMSHSACWRRPGLVTIALAQQNPDQSLTLLRWSETEKLKILIPDNIFFLYLIIIKLCTLKHLEHIHQN